jgi:hypothetical protein
VILRKPQETGILFNQRINMNHKKVFAYALLPVLSFVALGAGSAYAQAGDGGFGRGMHKGMHGGENSLVPAEMRTEWREEFRLLSDEEHKELRDERREGRQANRKQRHAEFEEFSGLTRSEVRELRQSGTPLGEALEEQGVTEEEASMFLTERAEEKVDHIVERHNLDSDDEQTLRDRIEDFVAAIVAKWFPAK